MDKEDEAEQDEHPSSPVYPPAADDVQQVDATPVDEGPRYRYGREEKDAESGGYAFHYEASSNGFAPMARPPVVSTWICLIVAWLFLGSRVPFTVFLGIPFDLIALLLAAVCLSRGGVFTGIFVFLLGTFGSFVVYLVGLFRFLAHG